jgi:hypothetical protein
MRNGLRLVGVVMFLAGTLCMPFPVTNPEAATSIFPALAMSGSLVTVGFWAMAIGAIVFALSFAFRSSE